jgi:hypothetical protein
MKGVACCLRYGMLLSAARTVVLGQWVLVLEAEWGVVKLIYSAPSSSWPASPPSGSVLSVISV